MRRLATEPREDDRKEVERLRQLLTPQFDVLDGLQNRAATQGFGTNDNHDTDDPSTFDDLDADQNYFHPVSHAPITRATSDGVAAAQDFGIVPPERRRLSIPSTWLSPDNPFRAMELTLRIVQASKSLQALRDIIADKSFQYSHVIRVAPRKGVRTRARATIAKLNYLIVYHCRVYGRCRAALARLGAEQKILDQYRILLKQDVRSSSALLNPNEPGSTRLQLSWIWQIGAAGNDANPEVLRECMLPCFRHILIIDTPFQSTGYIGCEPAAREPDGGRN